MNKIIMIIALFIITSHLLTNYSFSQNCMSNNKIEFMEIELDSHFSIVASKLKNTHFILSIQKKILGFIKESYSIKLPKFMFLTNKIKLK